MPLFISAHPFHMHRKKNVLSNLIFFHSLCFSFACFQESKWLFARFNDVRCVQNQYKSTMLFACDFVASNSLGKNATNRNDKQEITAAQDCENRMKTKEKEIEKTNTTCKLVLVIYNLTIRYVT